MGGRRGQDAQVRHVTVAARIRVSHVTHLLDSRAATWRDKAQRITPKIHNRINNRNSIEKIRNKDSSCAVCNDNSCVLRNKDNSCVLYETKTPLRFVRGGLRGQDAKAVAKALQRSRGTVARLPPCLCHDDIHCGHYLARQLHCRMEHRVAPPAAARAAVACSMAEGHICQMRGTQETYTTDQHQKPGCAVRANSVTFALIWIFYLTPIRNICMCMCIDMYINETEKV